MVQFVLIAKIVALSGSDGFLVVDSYSDFNERFYYLNKIFIEFFNNKKDFIVEKIDKKNRKFLLKIKGFNSTEDAKIFLGKKIFIDEKDSVKLSKNTFFIHDIIGSEVYRNKVLLGSVEDVMVLPANDVYIIKNDKNKKIFVPAIKDYIKKVDPVKKRIDLVAGCDLLYEDEN